MTPKQKVIIDCDPGHDDAVALAFAANSPELEIVGITCVAGNVDVEHTSTNALKICELVGMTSVPIVKGMPQPLLTELLTASHVHGKSGLDGVTLPEPSLALHPGHAVDFLIDSLLASNKDITLIPTGPLTNIAMAILREPRIIEHIPQIVLMGGSMGMGNVTASAEFNIYADPEAAKIVFDAGIPLTMVGLDVTHQAILTREHITEIRAHGTPISEAFASLLSFYLDAYVKLGFPHGGAMHDPCAVAAVCDPSLLKTEWMRVDIETQGEFTRGRTVCALGWMSGKAPNVRVAVDIDAERFLKMLIERLR